MTSRYDNKARAAVLTGDREAYIRAVRLSDFWWKLGGGKGR